MRLGIIGGSGVTRLFGNDTVDGRAHNDGTGGSSAAPAATPWGPPSAAPSRCLVAGHELVYLPRHGDREGFRILPHEINYRANLWALREDRVDRVVGINTVGGIAPWARAGTLVLPDQLIDYTWGRAQTYGGSGAAVPQHVDFTSPFDGELRAALVAAAARLDIAMPASATYGVTQGPRLETAAEIDRLERDGCDVVGMTAMPEAVLARELGLPYAICCLVVNPAAGRGVAGSSIHDGIEAHLERGMGLVRRLIAALLAGQ